MAVALVVALILSLGAFFFSNREAQASQQPSAAQQRTVAPNEGASEAPSKAPPTNSSSNGTSSSDTPATGSTPSAPGPPDPSQQPPPGPSQQPPPEPAPSPQEPPPWGDGSAPPEPPSNAPGPAPSGDPCPSPYPDDPVPGPPVGSTPPPDSSVPGAPVGSTPPPPSSSKPPAAVPSEALTPSESNPLPTAPEQTAAALSSAPIERPAPLVKDGPVKASPTEQPASSTVIPENPMAAGRSVTQVLGEASRVLPGGLQAAATTAVKTLQDTATNVANVLGGFLSGSSESSSPTNDVEGSSKGTPQPSSPIVPPIGGGSFSSLLGGGQGGIGSSSVTPILVGILMLGLIVLRPDGKLSRVFCELPKPSSALLLPLERPG